MTRQMMDADRALEQAALEFAVRELSRSTRRDGGMSAVLHALRVRDYLKDVCDVHDGTILASALLHDIVEATPTTVENLEKRFGNRVAEIVEFLTVTSPERGGPRTEAILAKLASAPPEAVLVKLAARVDAVRVMRGWSLDRVFSFLGETSAIASEARARLGDTPTLANALARAIHELDREVEARMRASEARLAAGQTEDVAPRQRRRARSGRGRRAHGRGRGGGKHGDDSRPPPGPV